MPDSICERALEPIPTLFRKLPLTVYPILKKLAFVDPSLLPAHTKPIFQVFPVVPFIDHLALGVRRLLAIALLQIINKIPFEYISVEIIYFELAILQAISIGPFEDLIIGSGPDPKIVLEPILQIPSPLLTIRPTVLPAADRLITLEIPVINMTFRISDSPTPIFLVVFPETLIDQSIGH